jgi:DNA-binding MarR family transcriptional regulator
MEPDQIDVILEQWRKERPDLDLTPMGVFGRISVLARVLESRVDTVFTAHRLRQGEFDVLTALRRSGPPYTLIPSELSAMLMMSRAGMTNRIDRLVAAGYVERTVDPAARRSFRVALTDEGRRVVDETMTEHDHPPAAHRRPPRSRPHHSRRVPPAPAPDPDPLSQRRTPPRHTAAILAVAVTSVVGSPAARSARRPGRSPPPPRCGGPRRRWFPLPRKDPGRQNMFSSVVTPSSTVGSTTSNYRGH